MKTMSVFASAFLLFLTVGVAQAADTNSAGAAVGTPGAENKGNPIPVPDQATEDTPIPRHLLVLP